MKRLLCVCLVFALFVLSGCSKHAQEKTSGVLKFYYLQKQIVYNDADSVISFETKEAGDETPEELLNLYLQGPASKNLVSPFPSGLKVDSIILEDNEVSIVLSKEIAELTGIDLTLACSCLTKTMDSILPAERYKISSTDGKLDGKSSILITPDTFLWEDQIPQS